MTECKKAVLDALRDEIYSISDLDILAPVPGDIPTEYKQAYNAGIFKAISIVTQQQEASNDTTR